MALSKPREKTQALNDPLLGRLAGEYRILRKLGAGGFGTVYEAEHPLLKRRAAVKVLHKNPGLASESVQRFIEEARAASQMRHRNIVDIFSFGTLDSGQYFYVMDLLDGAPLDRYLQVHGPLASEQALPLLRSIASALDALHAAGFVHRDIKPANIYLAWESSGEVVPKLLDFGLVKWLSGSVVNTVSGVPMGTPHYMAPEQCRGEKVDARADIYALGIVCHELLTGHRPFDGDSATAVLVAHVMQSPPRMSAINPGVPAELDEAVLQMLAKEPEQRPARASAAIEAIERAALSAGMTIGQSPAWLPRSEPELPPEASPPSQHTLGTDVTAEQSGLRTGPLAHPRLQRRALFGSGLALLVLGVFLFATMRSGAPPQPEPAAAGKTEQASILQVEPTPSQPSPAAASDVPEPPPADQPVAPAAQITLRLRGAPPGAEVYWNDRKLGLAAEPISLPYCHEALRLRVVAAGYQPLAIEVQPEAARELAVSLEHVSRKPTKRSGVPRDLEDPF
jgi:serine/threonine protein kinase